MRIELRQWQEKVDLHRQVVAPVKDWVDRNWWVASQMLRDCQGG